MKYYVIDVETTGLDAKYHEVTQISIIRCDDKAQLSRYIKAEYPERASFDALRVTGRTSRDLLKGEPKEDVVTRCDSFINEDGLTPNHRCFIGHSIAFDIRFCTALWQKLGKEFPAGYKLDTKPFTKEYAKKKLGVAKPKLTLEASLGMAGINVDSASLHNAIADSRYTYLLYEALKKEGIDHLPHIKALVKDSSEDSDNE